MWSLLGTIYASTALWWGDRLEAVNWINRQDKHLLHQAEIGISGSEMVHVPQWEEFASIICNLLGLHMVVLSCYNIQPGNHTCTQVMEVHELNLVKYGQLKETWNSNSKPLPSLILAILQLTVWDCNFTELVEYQKLGWS